MYFTGRFNANLHEMCSKVLCFNLICHFMGILQVGISQNCIKCSAKSMCKCVCQFIFILLGAHHKLAYKAQKNLCGNVFHNLSLSHLGHITNLHIRLSKIFVAIYLPIYPYLPWGTSQSCIMSSSCLFQRHFDTFPHAP